MCGELRSQTQPRLFTRVDLGASPSFFWASFPLPERDIDAALPSRRETCVSWYMCCAAHRAVQG